MLQDFVYDISTGVLESSCMFWSVDSHGGVWVNNWLLKAWIYILMLDKDSSDFKRNTIISPAENR